MAGRRRRVASATTSSGSRYRTESEVLRPHAEMDGAPEFVLEEAVVLEKDGKTMANVLEMTAKGPFIVRGKLVIDTPAARKRLIDELESEYIEIRECTNYAIGDGPGPSVWVLGKSGWMDLRPARVYRKIYDKMLEGVTLYYKFMDTYETVAGHKKAAHARQAQTKFPLKDLYIKYAVGAGDGVTYVEVEKRCDEHALFLLDQFAKEPAFDWTHCSFTRHLRDRYPNKQKELDSAHDKVSRRSAAEATSASESARTAHKTKTEPVDNTEEEEEEEEQQQEAPIFRQGRRTRNSRSRSVKADSDENDVIMSDAHSQSTAATRTTRTAERTPAFKPAPRSPAALDSPRSATVDNTRPAPLRVPSLDVVPLLIEIINEIGDLVPGGYLKYKYTKYTHQLYFKCQIKNHKCCPEILSLYANELLRSLDRDKWEGTPLWEHLVTEAREPPTNLEYVRLQDIPQQLVRRRPKMPAPQAGSATPSSATARDSAVPQPQYSGKTPRLRVSTKRPRDEMDVDDDSDVAASVSTSIGPGRGPKALRPATPPESDGSGSKPGSEDEDELVADGGSGVGGRGLGRGKVSKVVLRTYPLQTDKPKGPRGTWVCEEAGCGHVVRSAEEPEQRKLVRDHISQHTERHMLAAQAEEEGKLNGLPIQNLLDKIMKEAESKKSAPTKIRGMPVPERIKRVGLGW